MWGKSIVVPRINEFGTIWKWGLSDSRLHRFSLKERAAISIFVYQAQMSFS